jgi:tetratricopeptide (TPR) repeat protein
MILINKIIYILIFLMTFQGLNAQTRKLKKIVRTANTEMQALRYAYAIPLYKSYLLKGGTDTIAYKNIAASYFKVHQYDSALKYYQIAETKGVIATNKVPELYAILGNYNKAKEFGTPLILVGKLVKIKGEYKITRA